MVNLPMTKEARIYNGEKTVSSISGAGTDLLENGLEDMGRGKGKL